jgi:copper resistance protein C
MRSIRRLLMGVLGGLFFAAAMWSAALPAAAHDSVESSTPADGASVPEPPEEVSITLTQNPIALGSQIKVNDAAGTDWAEGAVEIVDNVASQKLKEDAPAGQYTVVWRVVSSDSHPIEGSWTFSVSGAATSGATTPGATAGAGTTAGATSAPASAAPIPTLATAQPGTTVAPDDAGDAADASEPFQWSLVIFVAVALGLLVALGILARRRLQPVAEEGPADEDEDARLT